MKRIIIFSSVFILLPGIVFLTWLVIQAKQNYKKIEATRTAQTTPPPQITATPSAIPTPQVPTNSNFIEDPSFEHQSSAWYSHPNWRTQFILDQTRAKSGKLSSLLHLDSRQEGSQSTRVYGVAQNLKPRSFPEVLKGSYYVESWQKSTPKQYLQVVVIIFDPDNIPGDIKGSGSYQIRYLLAGSPKPPLDIKNAKYIVINPGEPATGRWIDFKRNIAEDFTKEWGSTPKSFSSIRVLFEARWDDRTQTTPTGGKVWYDDLYLGTSSNSQLEL